jgi:hypothetical protein
MTRAILAVCLWSLCGLIGLYTARLSALNVETGQRLERKRVDLLWDNEENGGLGIQIQRGNLEMEERFGVDEDNDVDDVDDVDEGSELEGDHR